MKNLQPKTDLPFEEKHYTDGTFYFRTCAVFGWSILTTEDWCPLESLNFESVKYLRDRLRVYEKSGLFPISLHRLLTELVCDRRPNTNGYFMPFFFVTPDMPTKTQAAYSQALLKAKRMSYLKLAHKKQKQANEMPTDGLPSWSANESETVR